MEGWRALTIHAVPENVIACLEEHGFASESTFVCVSSRLLNDCRYGASWFVVARGAIAVVEEQEGDLDFWSCSWDEVSGARTQALTGGGVLILNLKGKAREVIRYTGGEAGLFGGINGCISRQAKRLKKAEDRQSVGHVELKRDLQSVLEKNRKLFCSTCEFPLPKNSSVCPYCLQKAFTLKRILAFTVPYRTQLIAMGVLMVSGTFIQLIPPQITRVLVDDVLTSEAAASQLWVLIVALAGIMILNRVIEITRARTAVKVGGYVTRDIQVKTFDHLQLLSLGYFNQQQTGALMSRVNNDARQMQGFLVDGLQFTVVNVLQIVGIGIVLLWMNPLLGFLVLVPTPLAVLLSAAIWKKIFRRFRLSWIAVSSVASYLNDALTGVRVIKAFGQEHKESDRFMDRTEHARDRMIDAEQTWQTLIPVLNLLIQSSVLLVWYFGAFEVYGGDMTVGELIAYVAYLTMIYGPLQLLTRLNDWLTRALTAAARLFEILDVEPAIRNESDVVSMPKVRGDIELKEVTFGYERHDPVLKEVSFKIEAGQMVGLVGHSGAGKSTVINIIGRLYDVDEGMVTLDGQDLRSIELTDLRKHVGYVLQETFLFNGSVFENIRYARPTASHAEVIEAAIAANAHEFIMKLPEAYDTYVGERGVKLSGGERQRIAIARALIHDPKILILDEATSSMDTETELKIQEALSHLIQGRTTIAIAHRLSTLRHANRLIVLDKGEVAEEGTHAELMEKPDGIYRKLVNIQTEWNELIGVGG